MNAHTSRPPRMRVHHIGLDARDALLLESALRMQSPTLDITFGPSLPDDPVDVLFVNGAVCRSQRTPRRPLRNML